MQPHAGSDLHDGAPHGDVFSQQLPKPNPFVYLSNLSVDAYEGAIRQAFEKEGIQVVSAGHCTATVHVCTWACSYCVERCWQAGLWLLCCVPIFPPAPESSVSQ